MKTEQLRSIFVKANHFASHCAESTGHLYLSLLETHKSVPHHVLEALDIHRMPAINLAVRARTRYLQGRLFDRSILNSLENWWTRGGKR